MSEIIVVKQLPEIEERLQEIRADVTVRAEQAMSLVCTEETLQTVKRVRAELNKEFAEWERRRKEVKQAIMSPYERFEATYRDCVTDIFKKTDADLRGKIEAVENELKEQKRKAVQAFFDEYLESKNIDFVTFENAGINVTLSASLKSLKEQARAFIDRICDDLTLIDTQEHKEEILVEYKRFLNVSLAITTVVTRHKAIEAERAREEERRAREAAAQAAAEKVEAVAETLAPPITAPVEEEEILTVAFKVRGTKTQLRALKEFLNNGEYDYE